MFTRITMRWAVVSIMAVTALAAISLMLNPASRTQAAPSFEFTWPSLLPPCNSTLQACVDLTNDGDQITILPGSYTTASITIRRSITVTSLLLQTTLQAPPGQRVITVTSLPTDVLGAQVHLINLTLTSGNVVTPNGQCPDHCGGGVLVTDRAHVWLDNVIIARNQAFRGGGVYVDRGSVTLNGGQITSNSAVDPGQILGGSGGGVYVAGALSIFEQNGGVIDANLATDGAGVFVQDGKFVQNGGEIAGNTASNWGGGLLVANPLASAQLGAGMIRSNSAGNMGGGIFVDSGHVTIFNGVITGNSVPTTTSQGGGIAVLQSPGGVFQSGGVVADNTAADGGGYYVISGTVVLGAAAQVIHNSAALQGGGIYLLSDGAALTQLGGSIMDNHADVDGGGVDVVRGIFTLRGGDVMSNSAVFNGGGAVVGGGGSLQVWGGRVMSNTASTGGGASILFGTATITGGVVMGNQANQGGGVFIGGVARHTQINQVDGASASGAVVGIGDKGAVTDNNASDGGGVYVVSGRLELRGGMIARNTASNSGGGIYLASFIGELQQSGGLVSANRASIDGGGLYLLAGSAQITGGQYANNKANQTGGGIASQYGALQVGGTTQILNNQVGLSTGLGGGVAIISGTAALANGVIISGNVANFGYGGGLYSAAPIVITGVRFINNAATIDGGGAYLAGIDAARVVNTVFARNTARGGAALVSTSSGPVTLLHLTVGDVVINPTDAIRVLNSSTGITDTIITSHTIGVNVSGGTLVEDYNLFFGNGLSITGVLTPGSFDLDKLDPLFVNPARDNYHLRAGSPAINSGVNAGVTTDLGGWPRPIGPGFDRGAFEYQALGLPINPNVASTLYYTSNTGTTTTVTLPPGLVTTATNMIFTSLVETPTDTPPPNPVFMFGGALFEIDAFNNLLPIPGITFTQPITIVIHYVDADIAGIDEATLQLYRYEHPPFGNGWCAIGVCRPNESQTVDTAQNLITAHLYGFSRFGRMGPVSANEVFLPIVFRE